MGVSIEELCKAAEALKIAQRLLSESVASEPTNTDLHQALRDSCIQRFEFCVELAWKTSIRLLALPTKSPATAVREMAQNGLIENTNIWFDFLEARNKTSHTYDDKVAQQVYAVAEKFVPALDALIAKLQILKPQL